MFGMEDDRSRLIHQATNEINYYDRCCGILQSQIDRKLMELEDGRSRRIELETAARNAKTIMDDLHCQLEVAKKCDPIKLKELKFNLYSVISERNFWENKVNNRKANEIISSCIHVVCVIDRPIIIDSLSCWNFFFF